MPRHGRCQVQPGEDADALEFLIELITPPPLEPTPALLPEPPPALLAEPTPAPLPALDDPMEMEPLPPPTPELTPDSTPVANVEMVGFRIARPPLAPLLPPIVVEDSPAPADSLDVNLAAYRQFLPDMAAVRNLYAEPPLAPTEIDSDSDATLADTITGADANADAILADPDFQFGIQFELDRVVSPVSLDYCVHQFSGMVLADLMQNVTLNCNGLLLRQLPGAHVWTFYFGITESPMHRWSTPS